MKASQQTGRKGEEIALSYMRNRGYELLTRNYRALHGEIDAIMKKDNILVFVEVKTRTQPAYGMPEEVVSRKQADKIMETAEQYMADVAWQGRIRFDVIAIELGTDARLRHIEDAFA